MTSDSPESAASTLACAASSIELSGTLSSAARSRNPATRSPGIIAACAATPGAGSRVHRGIAVNPPASTPRQKSRAESTVMPGRLVVVISHLPRGVSAPPCVLRDFLALHQEGVGGQDRAVAHRHAVMDHRPDPDRAAGTDRGPVGLEGAVLLRVALDLAARVEHDVIADGGQRPLGQVAAVVEDPLADLDPEAPPDQVLERGAVEHLQVRLAGYLPQPFVPPEVGVVDRAVLRLKAAEPSHAALH